MKLYQLQALVAIAEHGSIRGAARQMHISQAALTKALRLLETEASIALLVRRSSGVLLTEAGQRLLARSRLITRQLALAEDDFRQFSGDDAGTVIVGLTPYLMLTVLGQAFRWFRKRYPKVQLRILEGLVAQVPLALREGRMDFAIVADSGEVERETFSTQSLRSDEQRLVVRADHPILRASQPREAFAELEWVVPGTFSPRLDEGLLAMLQAAKLATPRQITRCDAMGCTLRRNNQ